METSDRRPLIAAVGQHEFADAYEGEPLIPMYTDQPPMRKAPRSTT